MLKRGLLTISAIQADPARTMAMPGNGASAGRRFLSFKQALVYARTLNLKCQTEWKDWAKTGARPANMPSNPDATYKHDGWQGYGHWLGTGNVADKNKQFLPFKKALVYARTLKLKSKKEWTDWAKTGVRPANMPSNPHATYKHDGWQGFGHWHGTGNLVGGKLAFLPFKKALEYARTLKLENKKDWKDWAKTAVRPANMPSNPDATYKHDGWQGYGHWLGTGNVSGGNGQQFLAFDKALLYAQSLKLENEKDWSVWCKSGARPVNIPTAPQRTYKHDGWQGYRHWLGTTNVRGSNININGQAFLPFKNALVYARFLKLKHVKEWKDWCKSGSCPVNVPADPCKFYKHAGWQGYGHWLGTL